MNDLQVFKSPEFGEIRSVIINDEPMFCLTDVCKALELTQPSKVKDRLSQKGVNTIPTLTAGGMQNLLYISEPNLYKTIFQSRKESAERFSDWVTGEVLPSIRKNGGYIAGQEEDPPEVLVAKALVVAQNIIAENQKKIAELTSKAEYFDALVERNLLTNLRDTAKELGIKERKFIAWLESKGFVYRDQRNKIKPFALYITGEKRYFEIKEWSTDYTAGTQTFVTPRGKEAFRLLFKG